MNETGGPGPAFTEEDIEDFTAALRAERGLAENTSAAYGRDLRQYLAFLDGREPSDQLAAGFVESLTRAGMASTTVSRKLAAMRAFHQFLIDEGRAARDPTLLVGSPKRPDAVPKALEVHETIALVEAPSLETVAGRRDRALLEVLYGTACRVSEAVGLDLASVDLEEATARVVGKGDKQRLVPLGRATVEAIHRWLPDRLELGPRTDAVFINMRGRRLSRQAVFDIVRGAAERAGLDRRRVSPHVLRHSAATHMIQAGADLRVVQELLGHANVSTTQVYTRVSASHIREIYLEAHPRSR